TRRAVGVLGRDVRRTAELPRPVCHLKSVKTGGFEPVSERLIVSYGWVLPARARRRTPPAGPTSSANRCGDARHAAVPQRRAVRGATGRTGGPRAGTRGLRHLQRR